MLLPIPIEIVSTEKFDIQISEERVMQIALKLSQLQTGMTLDELTSLVRYIEALREGKPTSRYYIRKEAAKIPRTIEIDPVTKRIFIHLKSHNIAKIGNGRHKTVTKSILYDPEQPQYVACAVMLDNELAREELALLNKFRNLECVIEPLYVARHRKKDGSYRLEIITPLYNRGSLRSVIETAPKSLTLQAKVKIARDILTGSVQLNEKGYVNRDNNRGNFFLHEENGHYKAVVGDLGGYTTKIDADMRKMPFGPRFRSGPPDLLKALYKKRLTEKDILSFHTYSVGRVLYFMLHEKDVPWIASFNLKYPLLRHLYSNRENPEVTKELNAYTEEVIAATKPKIDALTQKGSLTPHERFELAVLQMLSVDPEQRKTNVYWQKFFETFPEF
jgi:serine/threonine protein kinase